MGPDLLLIGAKFYKQRQRLLAFAKPFLGLIILCIPVAVDLLGTVTSGKHRLVGLTPGVREILRELRILTAFSYPPPPPYLTRFLHLYIVLLVIVLGIAIFKKPRTEAVMWVAGWAFLPLAIIFVYSHLSESIWITRYFMFIAPYIFLLMAVGFLKMWRQWRTIALGVALVYAITVGMGLVHYYNSPKRYMGGNGDLYRGIAQTINAEEKSGDIIVWSSIHGTSMPLEHYHSGSAPIYKKTRIWDNVDQANVEKWLSTLPPIQSRLWIVYPDPDDIFCDVIQEQFENVKTYEKFGKCGVLLITPKI